MKRLEALLIVSGILAFTLSGCQGETGPKIVPVTGTVLLDGEPVDGADVRFLADGASHTASGKTDAQGKFSLTTVDKAGAVIGAHTVVITKLAAGSMGGQAPEDYLKQMGQGGSTAPEYELPAKYSRPPESGLKASVEDGGANDFTFELTSK